MTGTLDLAIENPVRHIQRAEGFVQNEEGSPLTWAQMVWMSKNGERVRKKLLPVSSHLCKIGLLQSRLYSGFSR
ncbi:hypothetical protein CLOSTMETH_00836 [[Clostridium] methylpentosum DSM 5476]|uniref:Uncharacterized protein n=1 Tax=[Clostridium] methylpentosum DSM 5476 TaxID=537013 RepID=C0EAI1_9FIRM|nr:hypothetical protein CLOSTMETH_00836 [[Clostridium] methylpentosum DSM 5476]